MTGKDLGKLNALCPFDFHILLNYTFGGVEVDDIDVGLVGFPGDAMTRSQITRDGSQVQIGHRSADVIS